MFRSAGRAVGLIGAVAGLSVIGLWQWDRPGDSPVRGLVDNICQDGAPSRKRLDPPADATLRDCGGVNRSRK